jgi:hypothetical protein
MKKKENKLNVVGGSERVEVMDWIKVEWVDKALTYWIYTQSEMTEYNFAFSEMTKLFIRFTRGGGIFYYARPEMIKFYFTLPERIEFLFYKAEMTKLFPRSTRWDKIQLRLIQDDQIFDWLNPRGWNSTSLDPRWPNFT